MDRIVFSVVVAIAASLDNLGVGIAYGVQKIRVPHTANLIIAAVSFGGTWLLAKAGQGAQTYLSPRAAGIIGAGLLCGVGLWVLVQPLVAAFRANQPIIDVKLRKTRIYVGPTEILRYPERADIDQSREIGYWEAVLLGVALSINALAGGFDAGATGASCLLLSALVGAFSFVTILAGSYIGRRLAAEWLGKYSTIVAGALLVLIGIRQLAS